MTERFAFGDGFVVVPDALPDGAIDRARAIATLGEELAAEAAGRADVVLGGRSVLVVPLLERSTRPSVTKRTPASHTIEVVYDGEDLDAVASAVGKSRQAVIDMHARGRYTALLTGFLPGFAYLGGLDPALYLPRLPQPRKRVPAGAVAIAAASTGIYPFASPGGWNLLGRARSSDLFDPRREPATLIGALDDVTFVPRSELAPPLVTEAAGAPVEDDGKPQLVVEAVRGLATVQDRGRSGMRGRGVPASGPLDPQRLSAANFAVGNDGDAATVEVVMASASFRARGDVWLSAGGAAEVRLRDGERIVVDPGPHLVTYLAVRGGFDVPLVLGSRSTLLVAGFGGLAGRALRRGDRLALVGSDRSDSSDLRTAIDFAAPAEHAVLRAAPAPPDDRLPEGAFASLLSGRFSVSALLDRVGVRLDGSKVQRSTGERSLPDPTLPGAVQITNDGTPIVLGPDCAVTGGYPVVAVLDARSRSALGRARPGSRVTFAAP